MHIEQLQIINKIKKSVKEKYEKAVNPINSLEFEVLLAETFGTSNLPDLLREYTVDDIVTKIEIQMIKDCE